MTEKETKGPRPFDPGEHLSKVGGKDYLEVKWRLVWVRSEYPESRIETEIIRVDKDLAVFKCTATKILGGETLGTATGHGSKTPEGRMAAHYIEFAETKAIGRALGALGYGSQWGDMDEDDPADAPVQSRAPQRRESAPRQQQDSGHASPPQNTPQGHTERSRAIQGEARPAGVITVGQEVAMKRLAEKLGWDDARLKAFAESVTADTIMEIKDLSQDGAGDVITAMQQEKPGG
jgi:hypothetical protein